MHVHYILKLTASLAWDRKMPLYSIIFVQKFCSTRVLYLHMATKCCPFVMDNIH